MALRVLGVGLPLSRYAQEPGEVLQRGLLDCFEQMHKSIAQRLFWRRLDAGDTAYLSIGRHRVRNA